jgi:hypothetical protein
LPELSLLAAPDEQPASVSAAAVTATTAVTALRRRDRRECKGLLLCMQ